MADQPLTIQAINWRETLPFTNLFRAFRVAIHPSKVVLGLVTLLMLYVGGRVLDGLCPKSDRAVPGEAAAYEAFQKQALPGDRFSDYRDAVRKEIQSAYADELVQYKLAPNADEAQKAAESGEYLGKLKDAIIENRDRVVADADKALSDKKANAAKLSGDQQEQAEQGAQDDYRQAVRAAYDQASAEYSAARKVSGEGLFIHFFEYESSQISNVVRGVRLWNWFGQEQFSGFVSPSATAENLLGAVAQPLAVPTSVGEPGVIQSTLRFLTTGPLWLLSQHPFYFILLGAWFLVIWAIFGGAIARIAAVHVARDEKMSIRSALKFSTGKFLSFLFAPIIPIVIVVVVGILVTIGALLGNVPFLGPIVIGVFFFLVLAAGFVMALVLLGLVGGFNLMYPTIAVEGSDSFDAISRSFSYLYARPWRLGFYTIVAVVYGALTYLFVRMFIFLMLALAHKFVGAGIFSHAESTARLFPTMWPSPVTAARLSYEIDYMALSGGQSIGAALIAFWVYLVIAILGGFAISFYFSANTIIYYLMRREVDATEMDDVYLEQVDDEFAEPSTAAANADAESPGAGDKSQPASESPASESPPPA